MIFLKSISAAFPKVGGAFTKIVEASYASERAGNSPACQVTDLWDLAVGSFFRLAPGSFLTPSPNMTTARISAKVDCD
jgi:hypothetical protein